MCAPLCAQTPETLFQKALAEEKAKGDLKRAIAHYESVVAQYHAGRVDMRLAARAQNRLVRLKQTLGEQTFDRYEDGRSRTEGRKSVTETDRRLLAFREAFGIETSSSTSVRRVQIRGELQATGRLARHIQFIGSSGDPVSETAARRALEPPAIFSRFQAHLMAFHRSLGIEGLAETYRASYEERQVRRPAHPIDFYQVGLIAEREHGDIEAAIKAYQHALHNASPHIRRHIQNRLRRLKTKH